MKRKITFAFALLISAILTQNVSALTLTPTLDNSVFSYQTGSKTDYNFTVQEADSNGNITTKYYKIVLDKDKLSTSSSISWTELVSKPDDMANVVEIQLPNNQTKYFKYTYTTPSGYTTTSTRVDNTLSSSDVTDVEFNGANSVSNGGAIYNTQNNLSVNIKADFIGNYISSSSYAYGSAIYNHGEYRTASIGDITGDFIGNHISSSSFAHGGAVYNYEAIIKSITGNFIGNYATSTSSSAHTDGGAIYNSRYSTIGNITGDFIGNYISSSSPAHGGAIYNRGTISNIIGDFTGNYAKSGFVAYGGAISNFEGTIQNITGNFIDNYVADGIGGAIANYNSNGKIDNITGDFIGNYTDDTAGAIYNGGTINKINSDFISNYSNNGGAIYNGSTGKITNLIGNFINNYTSYATAYGGAVYNYHGIIKALTGDFIGNYAKATGTTWSYSYGGAIYNNNGTIDDITGNFTQNYATGSPDAYGGAIHNDKGTIGDITGNFTQNYITNTTRAYGAAIYNSGSINNITGYFINNYATGHYSPYGGAIYNNGTISNIIGDFIGNYAEATGTTMLYSYGGAIFNENGTIGNITGDFADNYAKNIYSSYLALGGAIYTSKDMTFTSGSDAHSISGNYTSDITRGKNYNAIFVNNSSSSSNPTITFDTTGGGSWTINDNIEGGKSITSSINYSNKYNLSFVGDDIVDTNIGTTTQFVAINNAIINAANVTVDGTTLKFGSYQHEDTSAKNALGKGKFIASLNNDGTENLNTEAVTNLTINNSVFDIANGYTEDIKLKTLTSNNGFYHIDVDINKQIADTFATTSASGGTVTLSSLNILNGNFSDLPQDMTGQEFKIQILKTQNDSLQLALSDNVKNQLGNTEYKVGSGRNIIYDSIKSISNWNDVYNIYANLIDYYGTLELATTDTLNDSIGISINRQELLGNEKIGTVDTLQYINQYETTDNREFNATENTTTYTVTENIGETSGGTLSVNGLSGDETKSVLDFNHHSGFELVNSTTLNLNNLEVKNAFSNTSGAAISITNEDAVVNINNVDFTKNYVSGTSAKGGAIYTTKDITVSADNGNTRFSGNYIQTGNNETKNYEAIYVDNTSAKLTLAAKNNGTIEFNDYINGQTGYDVVLTGNATGTINLYNDIKNADVSIDTITVNTADGKYHDYVFNTLTSDANTNYVIDVDINKQIADTFATTSASGGTVTLSSLNILNGNFSDLPQDMTGQEFKIQILKTQNDSLQLALSDNVKNQLGDTEYKVRSGYGNIIYDELKAVTTWEDTYNKYRETIDYYGTLGLATTDTLNDSIGININRQELSGNEKIGTVDTLQYINQYETTDNREFNATENTTTYTITENLGETSSGTLSVNGLSGDETKSVLDFNHHSGFELVNSTTLNLNDVEIKNANSNTNGAAISITNEDAVVNINNVDFTKNYVSGTSAKGGAIYTTKDITVSADNGNTRFSGNYVQTGNNETKNYEAIYVDNTSAKLTLVAKNNGTIEFNDYINGQTGYDVVLTGNATGTINLYNDIKNADVSIDTITVNTADGKYHDYVFNTLTSDANTNYVIDVDINKQIADTFATTSASDGTVTLSSLNILNGNFSDLPQDMTGQEFKIQILKTQNDSLQLALSDNVKNQLGDTEYKVGSSGNIIYDELKAVTTWEDTYNKYRETIDYYGTLGLATTDTLNDSIGINIKRQEVSGNEKIGTVDTLQYINQYETTDNREFNATENTTTYTVTENLGETSGGTLSVNGLSGDETKSVLDFNHHSGFELVNSTTLNLNNLEVKNAFSNTNGAAISITNEDAVVNINNVDFKNNSTLITEDSIYISGGAINNNYGTIGDITGNFIENFTQSNGESSDNYGGAINNDYGTIGDITGNFIENHAQSTKESSNSYGGAINNIYGTIGDITGNFIENHAQTSEEFSNSYGGAIENIDATIGNITGDFIKNHTQSNGGFNNSYGGAIDNDYGIIGDITGNFIENFTQSTKESSSSYGGAIANYGTIGNITGDFIKNHASSDLFALGGAIYTTNDMRFTAGSDAHSISGNYTSDSTRGKNYNAIFIDTYLTPTITFDTTGGGSWTINDNIEGGIEYWSSSNNEDKMWVDYTDQYNLSFVGDDTIDSELGTTTQFVAINNAIINAANVTVDGTTLKFGSYQHEDKTANNRNGKGKFVAALNDDGTENLDAEAVTSLMLNNAVFDIANGYTEEVKLKGFSATNSFYHLDINSKKLTADKLNIDGNVEGTTKLIVHDSSKKDIRGKNILFAQSTNDTTGTQDSFNVSRVYGSPYLYDVVFNPNADNSVSPVNTGNNNYWYLAMNSTQNPNASADEAVLVAPEVVNGISLPSVAITQKTGMINSITRSVTSEVNAKYNAWVDTNYVGLNLESPVDIESKVWGIQAGFDLRHNTNHNLGLFASYRNGNYKMDGSGKDYFSIESSEIDAKSYLGGLYYNYNKNNWQAFATVYGGKQEAETKTSDGFKADTDGVEFGASVEGGYRFNLSEKTYLTPTMAAYYTQVSYDDAKDNVGKTYKYEDIKQLELELGAKLGYKHKQADMYIKPSLVQTINDGDEVEITDLDTVDTLEDMTLGRVELGGTYGFNNNWSAYGWANHTFGSDYNATSVGFGLNYNW